MLVELVGQVELWVGHLVGLVLGELVGLGIFLGVNIFPVWCWGSWLVIWWFWCWVGNGLNVDLVRRIWLGLGGREKIVQHMGQSVSGLFHYLRPLVQHEDGFSSGNGGLLCEAETTVLASSCVGVGDADWLP